MSQEKPDWKPLEARLGSARCGSFMHIHDDNGIHQYKHVITRTYLNLDNQGNCYVWTPETGFVLGDFSTQLSKLEADLLSMGWDPKA